MIMSRYWGQVYLHELTALSLRERDVLGRRCNKKDPQIFCRTLTHPGSALDSASLTNMFRATVAISAAWQPAALSSAELSCQAIVLLCPVTQASVANVPKELNKMFVGDPRRRRVSPTLLELVGIAGIDAESSFKAVAIKQQNTLLLQFCHATCMTTINSIQLIVFHLDLASDWRP